MKSKTARHPDIGRANRSGVQASRARQSKQTSAVTKDALEARVERLEKSLSDARRKLKTCRVQLAQSVEQRTATAEILRVISSSPNALQPVFETILENATRLCDAEMATLGLYDGERYEYVAQRGGPQELQERLFRGPFVPPPGSNLWRTLNSQAPLLIDDVTKTRHVSGSPGAFRSSGAKPLLSVPMLKQGRHVGTLVIYRLEVRPFEQEQIDLIRLFANQAVIAIENVRLFNETKEALEQQKATAEILRAISRSPTDTQPVFEAVAESAARLCAVNDVVIRLVDANVHRAVAHHGPIPAPASRPISRGTIAGNAILEARTIHIPDVAAAHVREEYPENLALASGHRTVLAVPLVRGGTAIGVIGMRRQEVLPFTDKQIQLLETFAAQAVIAIENVRLFKELEARNDELSESLEQQTATAEILRVISSSPTNVQPVFDAIAESAARLCSARDSQIRIVEGDTAINVAHFGSIPTHAASVRGIPVVRGSYNGRAILERRTVHIHDTDDARTKEEYPESTQRRTSDRFHTILIAPLLRKDTAIGSIILRRAESQPFSDKQVELLQTFAAQAVIAIENVRLFKELQARNAEVTEALEQQTATAEILRVISSSPTDLRPVFDAILEKATQLCDSHLGALGLYDGEIHQFVAARARDADVEKWILDRGPRRPHPGGMLSRILEDGQPIQEVSLESAGYKNRRPMNVQMVERIGVRSHLGVPMLKDGRAVGNIAIFRTEVRQFTQKEIDLVSMFSNQAVIAIENVRMFNEIRDKSRQLEIANQHKSEFLANMSHELRTPLNAVIGFSEVLQQGMVGELNEKQMEYTNYIHTSGSHLLSLINDILDLSKVEAGRMELDVTHFSVPLAIDNALTLVKERATRHGLTLESMLDPALAEIDADERKFKQILLNLLSNAVKFTPEGGRITVAARTVNDTVEVSVTDTGIGIAPEDCAAVFEEFRQVGTHAEGKAQGTGLGLALTKKFIELHGGRIGLTSTPGKGSTFSFTLPLRQPEAQATAS